MSIKYSHLNSHSLSVVLLNSVSLKKKKKVASSACNKNSSVIQGYFEILIDMHQKGFINTSHFITKDVYRYSVQWSRLNKANNSYCFIKDVLRWIWQLSTVNVWQGRIQLPPVQFGATPLIHVDAQAVLLTFAFVPSASMVTYPQWKWQLFIMLLALV